ncbi:hypothetical protein AB833_22495 [Chromatiales bacterium (ex Bugula neritina AB1)]|nr:hypothetical protein AB833_22495 [Chromatiales bacterium (ex Bugula neritina AB1)]
MGLKNLLASVFGGRSSGNTDNAAQDADPADSTEYNGYIISPTPIAEGGQFKTAGTISMEIDGVRKETRFIRADNHSSRDQAIEHSLGKARQIIDERANHLFDSERC